MPKSWESRIGNTLLSQRSEVLLRVGKDKFSRAKLMQLQCGNFRAARILNDALASFKANSVFELSGRINVHKLLSIPGVGATSLWVWLIILDSVGVDVEGWLGNSDSIPSMVYSSRKEQKARRTKKFGRKIVK